MDRRSFTKALSLTFSAGAVMQAGAQPGREPTDVAGQSAAQPQRTAQPDAAPSFAIGMLIFDGMTNSDFAAPADVFARVRAAQVHVLGKSLAPITTDGNVRVVPNLALEDAPPLDLLFVPGGPGILPLMEDAQVLEFLASRAPRAQWVTSVCTGALVLGAAGLLRGYRATTHWSAIEVLPLLGAEAVDERVVIDRDRITGGGVTAGIDFGLTVVSELFGAEMAQLIQLGQEYNPHPPFNAGSPRTAPPEVVQRYRTLTAKQTEERVAAARRAASKFA
jgi:cyclohexyl-isocyanide hydratase